MDILMPDSGTVQEAKCKVCGYDMEVKRNCRGPASFASAMCGSKRTYDFFFCPHREASWHSQAKTLLQEAKSTPSGWLQKLYLEEVEEILKTRRVTKENF